MKSASLQGGISTLRVVKVGEKIKPVAYLIFDLEKCEFVRRETEYAYNLINLRFDPKTIAKRLDDVVEFLSYLKWQNWMIESVTDEDLKKFAEWLLVKVKADKSHRGSDQSAKTTVNAKLNSIFDWANWLSSTEISYPFQFVIPNHSSRRMHRQLGVERRVNSIAMFRHTGSSKRHKTGFIMEEDQKHDLYQRVFDAASNPYASHRNVLIAKIACEVGLRLESINCLQVAQFKGFDLQAVDEILVKPVIQKFNYEFSYVFSSDLASEILDFDRDYRKPLIAQKNNALDLSEGRIFLSSRDALPIKERSITHVFSGAMRALGAKKGNAVHACRNLFIIENIKAETKTRISRGMDTSDKAIAAAVAEKVGQTDPASIFAYVVNYRILERGKERAAKVRRKKEMLNEINSLKEENARLKLLVGEI